MTATPKGQRRPLWSGILEALRELGNDLTKPNAGARPVTFTDANRRLKRWQAWVLVLGVYAAIYGRHAWSSVGIALGDPLSPRTSTDAERIALTCTYLLIAAASVLILARLGRMSLDQVGLGGSWDRARVGLNVRIAILTALAMVAGLLLCALISILMDRPATGYPFVPLNEPWTWAAELFAGAAAGFQEEIPLVLVLVWALRSARYSWLVICIVAAVLRVSFHLYYGWEAVGLFIWPVLVVLLYARTGAIWGIIVAHAWLNLFGVPTAHFLKTGDPIAGLFLLGRLVPVLLGIYLFIQASRETDRRLAVLRETA